MGRLWHYLRYGVRALLHAPGFAAVIIFSLALGIGANTAIFSVLNALLLRELAVSQPERLVQLSAIYRNGAAVPFSFPMFEQTERRQKPFSALIGWTGAAEHNLEANGNYFLATVRGVTGNYYSQLEAAPRVGRLIAAADVGRRPSAQVAVLGYEFWTRRFARDANITGKVVHIDGEPFTIVGVTQKGFMGMTPGTPADITIPVGAAPLNLVDNRSALWMFVTGRLRNGITLQSANAQLQSVWPQVLEATVPTQEQGQRRDSFFAIRLNIESAATGVNPALREQFSRPLYLLMSIVGLILVILCLNLANLTLARAISRSQEISTRMALGARPRQVIAQLLAETLVLSAAGAALGVAFAYWGGRFLATLLMSQGTFVPVFDLSPDWRVFGFAALAALVTGVVTGVAPAWQTLRADPAGALRQNDRTIGRGAGAMAKTLIVVQVALSLLLLDGAGLFLRSLERLRSVDPGFQKAGVLQTNLYSVSPQRPSDPVTYYRQMTERIAELPGAVSVAIADLPIPTSEFAFKETVMFARAESERSGSQIATLIVVSPGFIKTLGIPLLSGRDFDWTDDAKRPPVVIIDSRLAHRLAASGDYTRERIRFGVQPELQNLQVVGVTRAARLVDVRDPDMPVILVPYAQHAAFAGGGATLFVRANNAATIGRLVEQEVQSLGYEHTSGITTVQQLTDDSLLREHNTAILSSFFAALALLLIATGLFALMSYNVTRRTREIGIRMALGSGRAHILRMVLRDALLLTLAGVAVGLPCALLATRLVSHMLFDLSPADGVSLAVASAMLFIASAVAGYIPARRAIRLNPVIALRQQ